MAFPILYQCHITLMTHLFSLLFNVILHATILPYFIRSSSKLGSLILILVNTLLTYCCLTVFGFNSEIYSLDTISQIAVTTLNDEVSWASCNYNNSSNNTAVNLDKLVVNLSDTDITHTQKLLLSRGLKFCPYPGEPDQNQYKTDLDKFHLKLKRELYFKIRPDSNSEMSDTSEAPTPTPLHNPYDPFTHRNFKLPSDWVPPTVATLENFIQQNEVSLNRSKLPKHHMNNISSEERKAIQQLTNNKSITIKPADKGGAVVVLNTTDYINEGLRQLGDSNFYIETPEDLTATHTRAVNDKIKEMHENKEIDDNCFQYLTHSNGRTAMFYMLPKIHKKLQNPPGRPIVSGNNCPTEKISQLVDFFLQPHVKQLPSYIKDTTHFLNKLDNLGRIPADAILVTLDVAGLYTNIPNYEGLESARLALHRSRNRLHNPSNESLMDLLKMVLTMNNFDFADRHYLQVGGTAMGTKVAPSFANTFMGWFEDVYVYTYHKQPYIWVRFIDDIFVIWVHGKDQLDDFIHYLNNCLPSIKFEAESSHQSVNFLDVTINLSPDGQIHTGLYTKPTDAHNYLSYQSCHPPNCKDSIPYSQFLRVRRICSRNNDFVTESRKMVDYFHRAGYPKKLLQEAFGKAYKLDRGKLLQYNTSDQTDAEDEKRFFLITTFHPSGNILDQVISNNIDLLDRSSATRGLLDYRIMKGYRRPKNLRDIIIRAKTTNPWDVPIAPKTKKPGDDPDERACTKRNCRYCVTINLGGRIHCPITNTFYTTIRKCNCKSNNLIYAIKCKVCTKTYVGQTKRGLYSRLCEHFRNIQQNNTLVHSVGRHYNEAGHRGIRDLEVFVLQFTRGHPDSDLSLSRRLEIEQAWISRLRSKIPEGLNVFNNKNKQNKTTKPYQHTQ